MLPSYVVLLILFLTALKTPALNAEDFSTPAPTKLTPRCATMCVAGSGCEMKCRSDICTDFENDCCAPDSEVRSKEYEERNIIGVAQPTNVIVVVALFSRSLTVQVPFVSSRRRETAK